MRFYFHLYDDIVSLDREGLELADVAAAKEAAIENARQIACAEILEGRLNLTHKIEVEDADNGLVATVRFSDAITVET